MTINCPNCGKELPDTAVQCYGCMNYFGLPPPVMPPPYMLMPQPQKKDNILAIVAILFVVFVALGVIGAAVMYVMVTGYQTGGVTYPPVVVLASATNRNGSANWTTTVGGVLPYDNDMNLVNIKIIAYKDGDIYGTLWLYDEMDWGKLRYADVTADSELSTGDRIEIETDGTDSDWVLKIVWLHGDSPGSANEYVVGTVSWST